MAIKKERWEKVEAIDLVVGDVVIDPRNQASWTVDSLTVNRFNSVELRAGSWWTTLVRTSPVVRLAN